MMELRFIDHKDPLLGSVVELGKKNSATLGLMPKDAYTEHARKKCIVVAVENQTLMGYCLFRLTPTKHRIGITQVCIDTAFRKQGVAKKLLSQIRDKYASLFSGMLVSCREDYTEACKLWLKFGFTKQIRVRSRSVKERYLFKFWYPFGKRDLFSNESSDLLRVALDLNILIKLHDNKANDEIAQLTSDWLTDEVEYCYARETFNEIHRDEDFKRTTSMLKFLGGFTELLCDPQESNLYLATLEKLHPGNTENHISDRKQLAECKACGVEYFVSIDKELIDNRTAIYETLNINILRPAEFILTLDELRNAHLYEPVRLQGARFEVHNVSANELSAVVDSFLRGDKAERKGEFQSQINGHIAKGNRNQCKVVTAPDGSFVAFYCIHEESNALVGSFVRIKKLTLSNTLFYQLIVEILRQSIRLNKQFVRIEEKYFTHEQELILIKNGFYKVDNAWTKNSIQEADTFANIVSRHELSHVGSFFAQDVALIDNEPDVEVKAQLIKGLEEKLWPVKFTDLDIPTYIVPIKPFWASQLFDHFSSNDLLFGSPPELSWSKENAYYRSVRPHVEKAPARILWYASQQKNFTRGKGIVGCSYLNEVSIGGAKALFSKFKRFGIYTWKEISKLSNGDIHHEIKVLHFSDSEAFKKPISFSETNKILEAFNLKKQTFVSPVRVSKEVFNEIYRLAK